MNKNKNLITIKDNFFTKLIKKLKNIFTLNNRKKAENDIVKTTPLNNNYESIDTSKKKDFINNIKVEKDLSIINLKLKLENNEIKAIDLTDDQIDELQKIYDKEIIEKQNKINRLKAVS